VQAVRRDDHGLGKLRGEPQTPPILRGRTWGTPAEAAERRPSLVEARGQVGRDAATMRTSVNALIGLDENTPPSGRAALFGTAQQLVDHVLARIKAEVMDQLPA
jgi:hypothetical protein